MQYIKLNNGVEMPMIGLGVLGMDDAQVRDAVGAALESGYRLVDTASRYYNEKAVGAALADAGVPRKELFITTKLWFKDHGYAKTKDAFRVSMDNLRLDYLDLYLIHQPFNDYYSAWHAMEELLDDGQIRAIGVSNFYDDRYFDLVTHNRVVPAVNQRETHPPQPADCDPGASAAIRHRASSLVAPGSGKRSSAHESNVGAHGGSARKNHSAGRPALAHSA
jgi:2,5-diketo-D-gluconate reductase A